MNAIVFACLLVVAAADLSSYSQPQHHETGPIIGILRDERHQTPESYSFSYETEDGVRRSEYGGRLEHVDERPIGSQGSVSFTFPNGEVFDLKFVADENGYQPQSPFLPVAPVFPHPIPQFVLDQIEKARREDDESAERSENPQTYPQVYPQ